jgi:hypothetical protein
VSKPISAGGRQLLAMLPEVYRNLDNGDLADYLDACGELLDQVRQTMDQLVADTFPDRPDTDSWGAGLAAQDWILPYLAQLLDVRLISPYSEGRRQEIGRAVAWRQRKGTLRAVEEIAEAVGQSEVEVQEGWQRVAVTPRVDIPILTGATPDESAPDRSAPQIAARHTALPAVTPDLRRPSRAVSASSEHPGARTSRFGNDAVTWRHANRHGVPCFPGGFDDLSRRTPDIRTPDWRKGHVLPRRAVLFAPPPTGFFPLNTIRRSWADRLNQQNGYRINDRTEDGKRFISGPREGFDGMFTITDRPPDFKEDVVSLVCLNFEESIKITRGRIILQRVAARELVVETEGEAEPVVEAVDCLFGTVKAQEGLVRLEYTTVVESLHCRILQASDSIMAGEVHASNRAADVAATCVRYSRVPEELAAALPATQLPASTTDRPAFADFRICDSDGIEHDSREFGQPGFGVLHSATATTICHGAEDGGEMGAYHHSRYCLRTAAILEKLRDFLPVGIEAVLATDPRLLTPPPEAT